MTRSDELSQHIGQDVTIAGIRLAIHRFASKQESMWLVDMADEHGMYQALWSRATLNKHRSILSQRNPVVIRGRVRTDRQGEAIVVGGEIEQLQ